MKEVPEYKNSIADRHGNYSARRIAYQFKSGNPVILPTETVYGLAADAFNKKAVEEIFRIKGRKFSKKLALGVSSFNMLKSITTGIPYEVFNSIKKNLPGPLTLVCFASNKVPKYLVSGNGTIAVRFSSNETLLKSIKKLRHPIVLTSANVSGTKSPVDFKGTGSLWKKVNLAVDTGVTKFKQESTILDITKFPPKIIRKGALSVKMLKSSGLKIDKSIE